MVILVQALFSGLAQGCVYALIALGYSVIYSTLKMGHFAQGDFYMLGAFIGLNLVAAFGLPGVLVFMGAALLTAAVMLILEYAAYRPMYNGPPLSLLICTLGMQYVVQEIAKTLWGSDVRRFPPLFANTVYYVSFLGDRIAISMQNVSVIAVCIALMAALVLFMGKTKTGIAMSAVSMNRKAAALMGVKISTIIRSTYIIAAALAAVAGVLMGPLYSVSFSMGGITGNKAMTAAIMGGFGSLSGAIVGGILLGIVETLGALYLSSAYKDVFSFVILIIILFCRPQGILGQPSITKV